MLVTANEQLRAGERERERRVGDDSRRQGRRREAFGRSHHRRQADSVSGSTRRRLPVAAAIAFATAGAIGGTPGSPTPVGLSVDGTICTSTGGISLMRSTR